MVPKKLIVNHAQKRHFLDSAITRVGNQIADRLTGTLNGEILNPPPWLPVIDNPAQVLAKVSKAMKAEVLDPETGLVDYVKLADCTSYASFRELTQSLPNYKPSDLTHRTTRTAFWINLYNALILDAVVHYKIQGSMMRHFWIFRRAAYNVGGMRFSVDDIEHGILRANRRHPTYFLQPFTADDPRLALVVEPLDPRIHFALVCGARACPPIAFYDPDQLDHQLDQAAYGFINAGGIHFDEKKNTLWLSKIFSWYQSDFGGKEGVLNFVRHYLDEQTEFPQETVRIRYIPYDWSVNALV